MSAGDVQRTVPERTRPRGVRCGCSAAPRPWRKWRRGPTPRMVGVSGELLDGVRETWENGYYAVLVRPVSTEWGEVRHLMIRRADGEMPRCWTDLQRIKDELAGRYATAVEVFPPDDEVVNQANMMHLWVLPMALPFSLRLNRDDTL